MSAKKTKTKSGPVGAFKTLAVTDDYKKEPKTNIPIPSDFDIKEGRDWVNHNQK